ncbi:MAG: DnaB-like helicase C-terminal domain-containing protein [Candidatus Heimdallarchaeaceae archaeon]
MKQLKQFLCDIHIKDTYIQYGELFTVDCVSGDKSVFDYLENNKHKDLYFLANVDKQSPMRSKTSKGETKYPDKNRGSDVDIIQKKYVYFDFDIYKEYEKKGTKLTPDEMKVIARESADKLSEIGYGDWSYLVYSGGGFHLYYTGKICDVNKKHHAKGYDKIAKEMSDHLGFPHDKSCKNVSRIARLPSSYNNKKGRDFSPVQVEILERREVKSDLLEKIMIEGQVLTEKSNAVTIQREMNMVRKDAGNNNVFDAINDITITDELFRLLPWGMQGEYNFLTETGNMSAAYLSRDYSNCIFVDESREFLGLTAQTVCTFTLVRHLKGLNNAETFKYFEENYPNIKALADDERRKYMQEKGDKEMKVADVELNQKIVIDYEKNLENKIKLTWGTETLDKYLTPIDTHHFNVVYGEESSGKTTFTFFVAQRNALIKNKVLYISLEMNAENMIEQMARKYSGITKEQHKNKSMSDVQKAAFKNKCEEIINFDNLNIVGFGEHDKSTENIKALIKKSDCDVVFIDNLDLISQASGESELDKQVRVAKEFMDFSKNEKIPVIMIHHCNKGDGGTKMVMRGLSAMRGSNKLADCVTNAFGVWRLGKYVGSELDSISKIKTIIRQDKDRDFGDGAMVEVFFNKGKFQDDIPANLKADGDRIEKEMKEVWYTN